MHDFNRDNIFCAINFYNSSTLKMFTERFHTFMKLYMHLILLEGDVVVVIIW
jgi:hypothetical protein